MKQKKSPTLYCQGSFVISVYSEYSVVKRKNLHNLRFSETERDVTIPAGALLGTFRISKETNNSKNYLALSHGAHRGVRASLEWNI
jgi:hypothetical protein